MSAHVIVIGNGAREHAIAWKLAQSKQIEVVYVCPGNGGTATIGGKVTNIELSLKNINEEFVPFLKKKNINLVVVGPEVPLADGISDELQKQGIPCFGPSQRAAQLESSKAFAKSFMKKYNIPTAQWETFQDADEACEHIKSAPYEALVVKASGLAAGKGVVVAKDEEEACEAVRSMLETRVLGDAGSSIVVEELLDGEEVSVLAFSDGKNIAVMLPAQDHKRLLEGNTGPNTGGMGAYCPCSLISEQMKDYITEHVLQAAIDGAAAEGFPFIGVLYAGLILTKDGIRVLEFNCRFGDPETQSILPLLQTDLYIIMMHCVNGTLDQCSIEWYDNSYAVGVVVASQGYPDVYAKDKEITGLGNLSSEGLLIFHSGTRIYSGKLLTSGGRVVTVVSVKKNMNDAINKAIDGASRVYFEGAYFRKDIAHKARTDVMSYTSAGVDIEAGSCFVNEIKALVASTARPGADVSLSGFGGFFDLKAAKYDKPVLVTSTHGVGTKMKLAESCGSVQSIGIDVVALCTNDLLVYGAEPLFFLDYLACGKLDQVLSQQLVAGIVEGCKKTGCALIGGETAEMPGMYSKCKYDIVGFAIGACCPNLKMPYIHEISSQDCLLGVSSSGLHCNGINLLLKLLEKHKVSLKDKAFWSDSTFEQELLVPTAIYAPYLLPLLHKRYIKQLFHISGKGLQESLSHQLPQFLGAVLDASAWPLPPVCAWILQEGISSSDLIRNFNCGIGLVLVVKEAHKDFVKEKIQKHHFSVWEIGHLKAYKAGGNQVDIINWTASVEKSIRDLCQPKTNVSLNLDCKKVCVLISGDAHVLLALISYQQRYSQVCRFTIDLVVSNCIGALGLRIAQDAHIPTKMIDDKGTAFEEQLMAIVNAMSIDIICLVDCSHILSDDFINSCQSCIIKSHPSLLPSFPSLKSQQEVLDAGVIFAGCTMQFLTPANHNTAFIEQGLITVTPSKTAGDLESRIQTLQQKVYPKVVEKIALRKIGLTKDFTVEKNIFPTSNCDIGCSDQLCDMLSLTSDSTQEMPTVSLCKTFSLQMASYEDPLLISGTDGVGTKLLIAQALHLHQYVGIDLVAMCVNDILTHGAEPLFFLSYLGYGQEDPLVLKDVMSGIVEGCRLAKCTLIDAQLSELPCTYAKSEYDLGGFSLGIAERNSIIPHINEITPGDAILALPSSGLHSNGFSLVRSILKYNNLAFTDPAPWCDKLVGEDLLTPTKIYVSTLLPILKTGCIKACAHITGGGLLENIPRVLPDGIGATLDAKQWVIPPVFAWLWKSGQLSENELAKTFNCGIGMILIVDQSTVYKVQEIISSAGETSWYVGKIHTVDKGSNIITLQNFDSTLTNTFNNEVISRKLQRFSIQTNPVKVGVLISGTGSNLQALINFAKNPYNQCHYRIVLVISNIATAHGLKKAEAAGIPTKVINHKLYPKREAFDMAVSQELEASQVEIICLAGFMRILSAQFVQQWNGKVLNTHPALLPAFKGMHAQRQALEAGVPFAGCTIHFVAEEVDAGAIIHQAAIVVDDDDTEESLVEKIKVQEHRIYPLALEMVASGRVRFNASS